MTRSRLFRSDNQNDDFPSVSDHMPNTYIQPFEPDKKKGIGLLQAEDTEHRGTNFSSG